jgi:FAD/FMN-containing dehydrogenase
MIELSRANPLFAPVIETALTRVNGQETDALLLVEFAGDDREVLLRQLNDLEALMADLGLPGSVVKMDNTKSQSALWEVRKAGLNIMMSLKGDGKPVSFIEDCAVPLEHLADYTAQLTEVFARHGTQGTWYAHASVGTLHVRPILDMRRDGAEKMRAIANEAGELVRRYKGAFSGEHGDGLVRSEWVQWQFGQTITKAFEKVKDAFDPDNLMNPGKIVRASKMDDRHLFRYKPGHQALPMTTGLGGAFRDRREGRRIDGSKVGLRQSASRRSERVSRG